MMKILSLVFAILLWCSISNASNLASVNGTAVGTSAGNINSMNGLVFGTSSGNAGSVDGLTISGSSSPISFSDNFNRSTLTGWTDELSTWDIFNSTSLEQSASYTDGLIRYDTSTNTVNHHISIVIGGTWVGTISSGVVLRDNNGSGWCYVVQMNTNSSSVCQSVDWWGYDLTNHVWSSSAYGSYATSAFVSGDTFEADAVGTGSSTQIIIKRNGTIFTTLSASPSHPADIGTYVGIRNYSYYSPNSVIQFTNMTGGDN